MKSDSQPQKNLCCFYLLNAAIVTVTELAARVDEELFYPFCRFLSVNETEILQLKKNSLSKEDKYQLVSEFEPEKKTSDDIYDIINDTKRWERFAGRHHWGKADLKYLGNDIGQEAKEKVLRNWLSQRIEEMECKDGAKALEELCFLVDDFLSEEKRNAFSI